MFKNYPFIKYSFEPWKYRTIVDRFFKLDFFDNFLHKNISFFKETVINDNETPEDVSIRVYHDDKYWFLILLINGITDPFFEWILTNDELLEYSKKFVTENYIEVIEHLAQNEDILINLSETLGETINLSDITIGVLIDPENIVTSYLIDHYFTILGRENNKRRKIYLPEMNIMKRMYNEFMLLTNKFE